VRRTDRVRRFALLLGASLGACSPPAVPPRTTPNPVAALPSGLCRVGPDGGPVVAERGIGGTGDKLADRGIGGTGSPQLADRGIGGTGIIGVVTGFASVCLAGQEVALAPAVPVTIDDTAQSADALRAGQVVAIEAQGPAGSLAARRITVRHEVSGPVEAVQPDGTLLVAGQRVAVSTATWMPVKPRPGDWVAVSGFRADDGTIQATRIDPRGPGPVLLHGVLLGDGGQWRIGTQAIQLRPGAASAPGEDVVVTGPLLGDALVASTLLPDVLADDPARYFGPFVDAFILEGFVSGTGRLRLGAGPGLVLPARLGLGRAVVEFGRGGGGELRVRSVRSEVGLGSGPAPTGGGSIGPGGGFEPAPMPNRSTSDTGAPGSGGFAPGGAGPRTAPGGGTGPGGYGGPGGPGEGSRRR